MDKNEVIILSSDDESDIHQFKKYMPYVTIKPILNKKDKVLKTNLVDKKTTSQNGIISKVDESPVDTVTKKKVPKKKCKNLRKKSPEIVDLVDCLDKSPNVFIPAQECGGSNGETEQVQSHVKLDIIDIDAAEDGSKECSLDTAQDAVSSVKTKKSQGSDLAKVKSSQESVSCSSGVVEPDEISQKVAAEEEKIAVEGDLTETPSNENLKSFTEFVEFCGSLEPIINDRIRLTRKLMKHYGEADSSYVESLEFRDLIQKCREKVNRLNLYLIAKDISAELRFRKKIKVISVKSNVIQENNQKIGDAQHQKISNGSEEVKATQEKCSKQVKKRTKFIKKIFKKLDLLGSKIQELENEEVDLSDEEGSSYIQLQRYRERFCQIYKKLCNYTNEIPDAESLCNRKICFTESKYPTINKCIELWLNKVKRFPDFTDIMKLLESQSSSLGLPSNKESLRVIATEIFQQVGAMLQRRRKYELWDSFCGFLNDQIDPANNDPVLEKLLKSNFEIRVKKEQEIFQYYSELQERERLEPEEVPDEEANHSPMESGNEDEKEIEEIENDINKRLDLAITEDTKKEGSRAKYSDGTENKSDTVDQANQKPDTATQKESKNNYRNCKSLKWRSENSRKSKNESANSEDSSIGSVHEKEHTSGDAKPANENSSASNKHCTESEENGKNDSDLEVLAAEVVGDASPENKVEGRTSVKRTQNSKSESSIAKRKRVANCKSGAICFQSTQADDENKNCLVKSNEAFDVHYCQVFADNVFESLSEKKKDGEKRKVFRDLTNVNRLMELHGKNRNLSGLFSPSFFYQSFREFEKSSWKRRFKVSFRMAGPRDEKCALSQEEKSRKSVKSGAGRESDEKNIQNNSEGKGEEKDGFSSGHGGESHEDGDEDRNRKNGRTDDEISESKAEEEEDDEDDKDENETENKMESSEQSRSDKTTDEAQQPHVALAWPSGRIKRSGKAGNSLVLGSATNTESEKKEKPKRVAKKRQKNSRDPKKQEIGAPLKKNPNKILEKKKEHDILGPKKKCGVLEKQEGKTTEKEDEREISELKNIQGTHKSEAIEFSNVKGEVGANEVRGRKPRTPRKNSNETEMHLAYRENSRAVEVSETETLNTVRSLVPKGFGQEAKELKMPANTSTPEADRHSAVNIKKGNGSTRKRKTTQENDIRCRAGTARKSCPVQYPIGVVHKRSTPSTSDEEIVKRFLLHLPSSISITPPRKPTLSQPPSQAVLQALATLRNLKGISTTIVRGKPKTEDDVTVIGGSYKRHAEHMYENQTKHKRAELPVISSVQSVQSVCCTTTPKIVTVQGNVTGFDANYSPEVSTSEKSDCDSNTIRISNVWGSLPNNFMQSVHDNEFVIPGCSSQYSQQRNLQPRRSNPVKKKNTKKKVEYVVLE